MLPKQKRRDLGIRRKSVGIGIFLVLFSIAVPPYIASVKRARGGSAAGSVHHA